MFASADEIHKPVQTKVKSDRQAVIDSNPLAEQIIPLLATFKDRIRSEQSWRVYCQDMKHFLTWLTQEEITELSAIAPDSMYRYHAHLRQRNYANATINRMFTVARRLMALLAEKQMIAVDPCLAVDMRKMPVDDETSHIALNDDQATRLMKLIDTRTSKGKRDYAIVSLLMRTGLRRNECVMLNIGDIAMEQGHYVATLHYAKGGKPGRVKIPPDV